MNSLKWWFRRKMSALVSALSFLMFASGQGTALEFLVNSTADKVDSAPGDGVAFTGDSVGGAPEITLRAAIQEANALRGYHIVRLPAGTYPLTLTDGIDSAEEDLRQRLGTWTPREAIVRGDLEITTELSIVGEGESPEDTVIDGNHSDRVFHIINHSFGVLIENLTIQNGFTQNVGGGIFVQDFLALNLRDVLIRNNETEPLYSLGGGMYIGGGGLVEMSRCRILGNRAAGAGGIFNANSISYLRMDECTVDGNQALSGHHIYHCGGITNAATQSGLAVARITNSTISNNSSIKHGGGIGNFGSLYLFNVTLSGNHSDFIGGGLFQGISPVTSELERVSATLRYCTLTGNSAGTSGGGIAERAGRPITLGHCILAGNDAHPLSDNCDGEVSSEGYNLEDDHECGFTEPTDLSDTDPLLGPLADNGGPTLTHALLPGSPAIDHGTPTPPPAPAFGAITGPRDQRGVERPMWDASDIGAYEERFVGVFPIIIPWEHLREDFVGDFFRVPLEMSTASESIITGIKPDKESDVRILWKISKGGKSAVVRGIFVPNRKDLKKSGDIRFFVSVSRPKKGAAQLIVGQSQIHGTRLVPEDKTYVVYADPKNGISNTPSK